MLWVFVPEEGDLSLKVILLLCCGHTNVDGIDLRLLFGVAGRSGTEHRVLDFGSFVEVSSCGGGYSPDESLLYLMGQGDGGDSTLLPDLPRGESCLFSLGLFRKDRVMGSIHERGVSRFSHLGREYETRQICKCQAM